MFPGTVVVHNQRQIQVWGSLRIDSLQEANQLLMPGARQAVSDDAAVEHAEGGEERGGAVALVIVRHGPAAPLLQWQTGLGSVECLYLGLLVDGQYQGLVRGIEIQP